MCIKRKNAIGSKGNEKYKLKKKNYIELKNQY